MTNLFFKFMKLNTFLLVLIFSNSLLYSQSPWTKKKGGFYTQLGFSAISKYNEVFGNPDYYTHREITDNTFQLYGEYGISDKTTVLLNVPYKIIKTGTLTSKTGFAPSTTQAETINTFGNIELGAKHNFYNNKWLLTGQLTIELNTGEYYEFSGIRTGYDAFTFTPLLNIGRSFNNYYIQAFTGLNFRTNGYSSNFKVGSEVGYKIIDKIWFIGFLDFVFSLENGNFEVPIQNTLTSLYINDQEYTAFGLKAIGEITSKIGLTTGFGGAFTGNNVAKEVAINFGFYYKMNSKKTILLLK